MDSKKIDVHIKSSDKNYYVGEAFAVSSINEVGRFDVLGEHSNFVTIIKDYVEVHKNPANKTRFDLKRGILRVKNNKVEVFIGI